MTFPNHDHGWQQYGTQEHADNHMVTNHLKSKFQTNLQSLLQTNQTYVTFLITAPCISMLKVFTSKERLSIPSASMPESLDNSQHNYVSK